MSDVEPVVIILLTFERTEYCLRTIESVRKNLRYPDLRWYVADDGSRTEHFEAAVKALEGERICGYHTLPGGTYGANANKAWEFAHTISRLSLWLEDDWVLNREFNLRPYADLLMDHEHLGMVRIGYIQPGLVGKTFGYRGRMYWWLSRESDDPHVFTGHPSLRHWRLRESVGPYEEGLRPGDTELSYAWQFLKASGPGIVWPAELAEYGVFGHIGERQSY